MKTEWTRQKGGLCGIDWGNEIERAAPVRAGMKNAPAPVPYILVIDGKELFYEFQNL